MVDEIDEKILSLLEENARMSYVEIGNSVGLSEGAVRNRISVRLTFGRLRVRAGEREMRSDSTAALNTNAARRPSV